MRNLHSILSARLASIRKRIVKSNRTRRTATGKAGHPGLADLAAQLARASKRIRGSRHGRRTG